MTSYDGHEPDSISQLYRQLEKSICCAKGKYQIFIPCPTDQQDAVTMPMPPLMDHDHVQASMQTMSVSDDASSTSTDGFITASNGSNVTPESEVLCACRHVLVSVDSEHCGLCDQRSPQLKERQDQRLEFLRIKYRYRNHLKRLMAQKQINETEKQMYEKTIQEKRQLLDQQLKQLSSLKEDMSVLHSKYMEERYRTEEIRKSTENLKCELEELSQRLFVEANKLIGQERKEKKRIQDAQKRLEEELKQANEELYHAKEERQMWCCQPPLENTKPVQAVVEAEKDESISRFSLLPSQNILLRANIDLTIMMQDESVGFSLDVTENTPVSTEFQQFIKDAPHVSLRKLHQYPFMKQCLVADIEPCLRFGPNPRMTSKNIIEAMVANTCFVEKRPTGVSAEPKPRKLQSSEVTKSLWERFGSPRFHGCPACGRRSDLDQHDVTLKYSFRISHLDQWATIDQPCYNRLKAVADFYRFIRKLRRRVYENQSVSELYQMCVRLRLQMFMCRMGILINLETQG
ncbi:uncharacterized protein BYT42DRAFT_584086 [Radiomyces spectabilis]|uniref:uncharacterized protein n=1 Tax=Radiomyces spectabilis TaxID=64574 RepID=UPI0022205E46|nr:uncharacterized protein BYT42DRAFT_584086 [Radiomyces spectabilis]KAI8369359.1 hypothetical protein BYT42DRAFT_584086 [Radiomyces spectabilis]